MLKTDHTFLDEMFTIYHNIKYNVRKRKMKFEKFYIHQGFSQYRPGNDQSSSLMIRIERKLNRRLWYDETAGSI